MIIMLQQILQLDFFIHFFGWISVIAIVDSFNTIFTQKEIKNRLDSRNTFSNEEIINMLLQLIDTRIQFIQPYTSNPLAKYIIWLQGNCYHFLGMSLGIACFLTFIRTNIYVKLFEFGLTGISVILYIYVATTNNRLRKKIESLKEFNLS